LVDLALARQSQQAVWSMHAKPGDAPAKPHTAPYRRICRTKEPKGVQ
jgi:hypothetical protein